MERLKICQQIYERLASLEVQREEVRIANKDVKEVDAEMAALRKKLQNVMNSPCPVIKDSSN